MKQYLTAFAAAALLLTGCQNDVLNEQGFTEGENTVVTFSAELPQSSLMTRAINSAEGGIVNMDWENYQVRYIMEVYSADGTSLVDRQELCQTTAETARTASFDVDLVTGNSYQVAFWADFVSNKDAEPKDLYYNTGSLKSISLNLPENNYVGNNDLRDAYFANSSFTVNGPQQHQITLRRPFGKFRVITLDADAPELEGVNYVKVDYATMLPTGINALSGQLTTGAERQNASYTAGISDENMENGKLAVAFDYILAPPTTDEKPVQVPYNFKVTLLNNTTEVASYDFQTSIPIERNHLTTITGNLFTDNQDFEIEIDDEFDGEETVYEYKTADEAEVGDFYLSNGQFIDGQEELTDEMKAEIVGVVFAPKNEADYSQYSFNIHGYVMALDNISEEKGPAELGYSGEGIYWDDDVNAKLMASETYQADSWSGYLSMEEYEYYYEGDKLVLFDAVLEWEKSNPAPLTSSGWFVPAAGQLKALCEAAIDNGLNSQIEKAGGVTIKPELTYLSATEEYDQGRYQRVYVYRASRVDDGKNVMWGASKDYHCNARPILAY